MYLKPVRKKGTIYGTFLQNLDAAGVRQFVKPYPMTSRQARGLIDTDIRILFVDGDHAYEEVKTDICIWQDLLLPGGYIALHDFRPEAPDCVRAIRETIMESPRYECLLTVDSLLIAQKTPGS